MSKNYKVVFTAPRKVELQECDMPVIGDDEFLLETIVSQISIGTELTMLEGNVSEDSYWNNGGIVYPVDAGYSNIGRIIDVGKNVSKDLIGKRFLTGRPHTKYSKVGLDWYQETMLVPDDVESDDAVFGMLAQIAMGSVRASQIRPGDACVVYGAGLIGQMVARLAKCAGSTKVFVCDVSDNRLSKLPDDPCFIKINTTRESAEEVVKANTFNNEGADVVYETTSVPSLIEEELKCLTRRGKLIITSSPKGKSNIDFHFVSCKGITIIGAHNMLVHQNRPVLGDPWTRRNDSLYFLELLDKKQITVSEMITHRCNYKDVIGMYEMLMEDRTKALSVNINWED